MEPPPRPQKVPRRTPKAYVQHLCSADDGSRSRETVANNAGRPKSGARARTPVSAAHEGEMTANFPRMNHTSPSQRGRCLVTVMRVSSDDSSATFVS